MESLNRTPLLDKVIQDSNKGLQFCNTRPHTLIYRDSVSVDYIGTVVLEKLYVRKEIELNIKRDSLSRSFRFEWRLSVNYSIGRTHLDTAIIDEQAPAYRCKELCCLLNMKSMNLELLSELKVYHKIQYFKIKEEWSKFKYRWIRYELLIVTIPDHRRKKICLIQGRIESCKWRKISKLYGWFDVKRTWITSSMNWFNVLWWVSSTVAEVWRSQFRFDCSL